MEKTRINLTLIERNRGLLETVQKDWMKRILESATRKAKNREMSEEIKVYTHNRVFKISDIHELQNCFIVMLDNLIHYTNNINKHGVICSEGRDGFKKKMAVSSFYRHILSYIEGY